MSVGVPAPFVSHRQRDRTLVALPECLDALLERGLDRVEGWDERLGAGARGAGRGTMARLELPPGTPVLLKRMHRGGLAAGLWRGRFLGRRRLLDNLRLPSALSARGVATARPLGLLMVEGPPGLFRAWMAFEELRGATDLGALLASPAPLGRSEWAAALAAVRRMHDGGVEHRDLNVGNLLLRRDGGGEGAVFVIDLDRARLHAAPLAFRRRQRALRRLERSIVKHAGGSRLPGGLDAAVIYELYAAEDARLADRLRRGRTVGRLWLGLHRLGWGRGPGSRAAS